MAKRRIFFDTDPFYNCTRIDVPADGQNFTEPLPPTAINARIVDDTDIPVDRTFRNALMPDLTYDMVKCRLLAARKLNVSETDPRVVSAQTPDELKVLIVKGRP